MAVNRANRAIAYHAIDTEREYQEEKWPDRPGVSSRTVEDFTKDIDDYTKKLKMETAFQASTTKRLETMRKIAALCVACFELHGVPLRDGYAGTLEQRVEVLKRRALARIAAGELSVQVTRSEYEDLVEAHRLNSLQAVVGEPPIPTFMDLVVDRLDI